MCIVLPDKMWNHYETVWIVNYRGRDGNIMSTFGMILAKLLG